MNDFQLISQNTGEVLAEYAKNEIQVIKDDSKKMVFLTGGPDRMPTNSDLVLRQTKAGKDVGIVLLLRTLAGWVAQCWGSLDACLTKDDYVLHPSGAPHH